MWRCFLFPHKNGPFDSLMQNCKNLVCTCSAFSPADQKISSEDTNKMP
jgi:hypothetical protein